MPSLLSKYKKRRESHKGDDGASVTSHDADQRSPSGSSVRSTDATLSGAPAVGGLTAGASATNGHHFMQLPQNAQQSAQQAAQKAQQQSAQLGQKTLNSPFLGQKSPQNPSTTPNAQHHNGAPVGHSPGAQPGVSAGGLNGAGHGLASPSGSNVPQGAPMNKAGSASSPSGSGGPNGFNGPNGLPNGHPNAPPHAPSPGQAHTGYSPGHPSMAPPHGQQGHPRSPISPPPHGQAPMPQSQSPSGVSSPHGMPPSMHPAVGGATGLDASHERDRQFQQRYRQPLHESYKSPLSEPSETPWAEYAVQRACPSPRFGHSANYIAARDGELFIMGGIRESDIMSDLWVIDTNMLTGYQLVTEGARVGPRVGHSSLVLGNAHVMFGGDTKIEETDPLDDNLYLLNTSSLKWTVAQPVGPRPTGRYGHSLSNVGARIYVFGGQVDEQFYNDMWAFDLQSWRSPSARWELIQSVSEPPTPRTNHTVVTWNDKLYLFGGANGDLWYSDTWCFDPVTRRWDQLDCTGYVPAPCQGHAATIIGDVMYVFGGMSSQGVLIDQLFALKLTTLKWYTFQNLGPGPSPRSGHSLTAFGTDKILVWGGTDQGNSAYVLDVSRINYPDDHQESVAAHDAPSVVPPVRPLPPNAEAKEAELSPQPRPQGLDNSGPTQGRANPAARNSMLFAKRRSVIAPSSPVRGSSTPISVPHANSPKNLPSHSSPPGALADPPQSQAQSSDNRSPNRTHITPTSYVSEHEGSSDERFVSAVEVNDASVNGQLTSTGRSPVRSGSINEDQSRSWGHTREASLGGSTIKNEDLSDSHQQGAEDTVLDPPAAEGLSRNNTLTRADGVSPDTQDQRFDSMEKELGGMPGGLPRKPVTRASDSSLGSEVNTANALHRSPSSNSELDGDHGEKANQADWKSSEDYQSIRTPGLRRSQPQTNLALQSFSESDEKTELDRSMRNEAHSVSSSSNDEELGSGVAMGAVGAAGAGLIGLSDQMNLPPGSHAVAKDQVNHEQVGTAGGYSVGTPAGQDARNHGSDGQAKRSSSQLSQDFPHAANAMNRSSSDRFGAPPSPLAPSLESTETSQQELPTSVTTEEPVALPVTRSVASPLQASKQATSPVGAAPSPRAAPPPVTPAGPVSVADPETPTHDPQSQSSPKGITSRATANRSLDSAAQSSTISSNGIAAAAAAPATSASVTAELAQLRKQLDEYRQRDLDGDHHKLKESHATSQRELLGLRDAHGQLQNDHARLRNDHEDLQQRYSHVQQLMDGHVQTLSTQQEALSAATAKLQTQQEELSRLSTYQSENADLKHQLQASEAARKHAESQLEALNETHRDLKSAHSDLSEKHTQLMAAGAAPSDGAGADDLDARVNHLVNVWAQFNSTQNMKVGPSGTRELNTVPGDDYRSLYETHKTAADSAQRELETAYSEQAQLKAQIRDLSAMQSAAPSTADLDLLKEQHQSVLSQMEEQHRTALEKARSATSQASDELRARVQRLEASYEELNDEYHKAVDLSKNQQSALARTREELNMSRAHSQRLEEQLEDASIHAIPTEGGDVSAHSVSSARNDQAALVIRDLRAQIVILEEEMQGQREQIMRLKKAALTTAH